MCQRRDLLVNRVRQPLSLLEAGRAQSEESGFQSLREVFFSQMLRFRDRAGTHMRISGQFLQGGLPIGLDL